MSHSTRIGALTPLKSNVSGKFVVITRLAMIIGIGRGQSSPAQSPLTWKIALAQRAAGKSYHLGDGPVNVCAAVLSAQLRSLPSAAAPEATCRRDRTSV